MGHYTKEPKAIAISLNDAHGGIGTGLTKKFSKVVRFQAFSQPLKAMNLEPKNDPCFDWKFGFWRPSKIDDLGSRNIKGQ